MSLYAAVIGIGIISFVSLYACFSISERRILEKGLLYAIGLSAMLTIPFVLYADSLEAVSVLAPLTGFFEKYFMLMIYAFIAVLTVFFLHLLLKQVDRLVGGKGEE